MTKEQRIISRTTDSLAHVFRMDMIDKETVKCNMQTDKIRPVCAFIGKKPESQFYGYIIGIFRYETRYFKFYFHVHKPNQKKPELSNKMQNIQEIEVKTMYNEEFLTHTDSNFGHMAFWAATPLSYLFEQDKESYELRKFMQRIIAYSRKENLCKYFRKMDRKRLKYLNERQPLEPKKIIKIKKEN